MGIITHGVEYLKEIEVHLPERVEPSIKYKKHKPSRSWVFKACSA
ncbi:hypothetical protein PPIS_a4185 [Pseudoalteromonas piscicida]|uniref:Transposase n=1 Tax=Pseudoalteromonas piscicida TaxID=43662 RepID=A0ABM6NJ04_PSEO7|nr:hypothetical protein PPIS_a4185 [Pseudoalteromonas piscicida]